MPIIKNGILVRLKRKSKGDTTTTEGFTMHMHKVPVALAAFVVFLGCDVGSPTSPSAAKRTEAAVEQCPMPTLGIVGTWAKQGSASSGTGIGNLTFSTADTLRIEFAPDPNPTGEPGVTYYEYTELLYYSPSDGDDPELLVDLLGQPSPLWREEHGKMGVYYAGDGEWAFNSITTYSRIWNPITKEYEEWLQSSSPWWSREIKMFNGWLFLGSEYYNTIYKRVDGSIPVEPEPEPMAELTPEIVGLYGTLISSFTNIFFAALVPGTTSVLGEGGGSVEIAGNNWTFRDYSPDGELVINGALNVGLDQTPISLSGEVTFSGLHEAELMLDIALSVDAGGLSATGTITINGAEFDVAEVSAAAAAAAAVAGG